MFARILSAAAKSPWFWPLVLFGGLAAVGQWVSATAALVGAAGCAAIGLGIAIGLAVAGTHAGRPSPGRATPASKAPVPAAGQPQVSQEAGPASGRALKRADLRGASLVNTTLVGANLSHADLRGANLTGANLRDADLTGAQLGPLEDVPGPGDSP